MRHQTDVMPQAFVEESIQIRNRLKVRAGVHTLYYGLNNTYSIEPRLAANLYLRWNMSLKFSAGITSQLQYPGTYLTSQLDGNDLVYPNLELGMSKARNYELTYVVTAGRGWEFKVGGYFQDLYNIPVFQDSSRLFSTLNLWDGYVLDSLANDGVGRNYGMEVSARRNLGKDFYLLASGSYYRSEFAGQDKVWMPSRFDSRYMSALSLGKEWSRMSRKKRIKTFGLNFRSVYRGGLRAQPIDLDASRLARRTIFDSSQGFSEQLPDYFRTDLRFIYRVDKERFTGTLGFDLQNMLNTQNVAYRYYDFITDQVEDRFQLGIIPNLSYRMEF